MVTDKSKIPGGKERRISVDVYWRLAVLLCFFTAVMTIVLEIQIQQRNSQLDDTQEFVQEGKTAADQARVTSEKASNDLAKALELVNSPEAKEQTLLTRQRIINMEYKLCGGPCPQAPVSATAELKK